jgi:hypothetical protein
VPFEKRTEDVSLVVDVRVRQKVEEYIFICDPSVRDGGLAAMLRPLLREFSFRRTHMFGDLFPAGGDQIPLSLRSATTESERQASALHGTWCMSLVFQFYFTSI